MSLSTLIAIDLSKIIREASGSNDAMALSLYHSSKKHLHSRINSIKKIRKQRVKSLRNKYIMTLNKLRAELDMPPFIDRVQTLSDYSLTNVPCRMKRHLLRIVSIAEIRREIKHMRDLIANNYMMFSDTSYKFKTFYGGISPHVRLQMIIDYCSTNSKSFNWFVNNVFNKLTIKDLIKKINQMYRSHHIVGTVYTKTSWINLCREYFMLLTIGTKRSTDYKV